MSGKEGLPIQQEVSDSKYENLHFHSGEDEKQDDGSVVIKEGAIVSTLKSEIGPKFSDVARRAAKFGDVLKEDALLMFSLEDQVITPEEQENYGIILPEVCNEKGFGIARFSNLTQEKKEELAEGNDFLKELL